MTQKKVSGHADESTMARMTVTRKTMISMIKLQTTRVVRLPLGKHERSDNCQLSASVPAASFILPEIYENVHPVEEDIRNLRSEADVGHKVRRVLGVILPGVVCRQLVAHEVILGRDEHVPGGQGADSVQNEDEENQLVLVCRRLAFQLRPLHRHAFEVELIIGYVLCFPRPLEADRLRRVIPAWEVQKKNS